MNGMRDLSEILNPRRCRIAAPERTEIERALAKLPPTKSFVDSVPVEQAPQIAERVRKLLLSDGVEKLSSRDLRLGAETLWVANSLAQHPSQLSIFLDEVRRRQSRSPVSAAFASYLQDFDAASARTKMVAGFLHERTQHMQFSWSSEGRRLRLFEPQYGPAEVAGAIVDGIENPHVFLESIGLQEAASSTRYASSAFKSAIKMASSKVALRDRRLLRLLDWAETPDGVETFPELTPEIAEALLTPWPDAEPAGELGERIRIFILAHYKDPRTQPARWVNSIDKNRAAPLRATFERWLTVRSIHRFLDIVGLDAEPNHWKYRRAFWLAYLEKKKIAKAWVVFGPNGAWRARDQDMGEFGKLGRGRSRDHSVLLMQIGDLVIADWSHNAKCHMWKAREKNAPVFFRPDYEVDDLASGFWQASHTGSDRGNWQRKFSDHIHQITGVRISEYDWSPQRRR